MTQVVTVHTDFTDLNQMAQGLVGRVNETHVILPGPEPVDVGDWVQFAVTLYDGTPGFAGVGRCVTVVDNGEERMSHQRFDVVIDSLQFDPRGQQVFQHILTLNGVGPEGYEGDGEMADASNGAYGGEYEDDAQDGYAQQQPYAADDAGYAEPADEGSYEDVSSDFTGAKIQVEDVAAEAEADDEEAPAAYAPATEYEESDATVVAEASQFLAESTREPEPDEEDEPATVPPPRDYEQALTDSVEMQDLEPAPVAAPATFSEPPTGSHGTLAAQSVPPPPPKPAAAPAQVNGVAFAYPNGLPIPNEPPRPELDPSQRVSPAPRPAGSSSH